MAVRFVIGRSGSGKTRRCQGRIAEAMRRQPLGAPIYLLLPKQATFQAERELTCRWGLGAFCRARVVSFTQLAKDIQEECGGVAIPQITPMGRRVIIGHLLRRHEKELKFFGAAARQPGLAARLEMTLGEFEHAGKTPEDVEQTIAELKQAGGEDLDRQLLLEKLQDLRLLYGAYREFLGQERLDPARRLQQVLESISSCKLLRGADIYVDGFHDFGEYERQILAALARVCRDIEITLTIDPASEVVANPHKMPDELGLFYRTEMTFRDLHFAFARNNVAVDEIVRLEGGKRFVSAELKLLETGLFGRAAGALVGQVFNLPPSVVHCQRRQVENLPHGAEPPVGAPAALSVLLAEAGDRRREADLVARHVQTLLRQGMRLREIAVFCRDLSMYHDELVASFGEHDIPCFVDRPQAMAHHPLVQFVKSAVALPLLGWAHESVMALLKSGLVGIEEDQLDALENYVAEHRILGPAWTADEPWDLAGRAIDEDDNDLDADELAEREQARRAQEIRADVLKRFGQFLDLMRPAPGQTSTLRAYARGLYEMLKRFEVPTRLAGWIRDAQQRGQVQQQAEHQQVWIELMDLLDQLVDLLGDEAMEPAAFAEVLLTGLEDLQLALPPQGLDQVLIGQVDRTRAPAVKAVIIMGLSEGIFPRVASEDSILSDSERRTLRDEKLLRTHHIRTHAETDRALLDENFLAYLTISQPSHRLILTRPAATADNKAIEPSVYWRRVRQLLPAVPVLPPDDKAPEAISTPRQLVTRLMRWVRDGAPASTQSGFTAEDAEGRRGSQKEIESETSNPKSESPLRASASSVSSAVNGSADSVWPALYHWLATHECCSDRVDIVRFRSWKALGNKNTSQLSSAVAKRLFPSPLRCSVSQIEAFARCPFQHYCRYGLRLQKPPENDPTALDQGNVYHQTLEKLVRGVIEQRLDWRKLPEDESRRLIHECTQRVGEELRERIMLSTARNRHILQRIEQTVEHVARCNQERGLRSAFNPAHVELGFGFPDARLPALSIRTPAGREALLRGKIDRVDVMADQAAFAVIDYKLSRKDGPLSLSDVYFGLSLQLLTYLLVVRANSGAISKQSLSPAAALYVRLMRELEEVAHPAQATPAPDLYLKPRPRGIVDTRYLASFDSESDGGKSSLFTRTDLMDGEQVDALLEFVRTKIAALADLILEGQIAIAPYRIGKNTPCPRCDFRPVCRFESSLNSYMFLTPPPRKDILERLIVEGGGQ